MVQQFFWLCLDAFLMAYGVDSLLSARARLLKLAYLIFTLMWVVNAGADIAKAINILTGNV